MEVGKNRFKNVLHIALLLNLIDEECLKEWSFRMIEKDGYSDFLYNLSTAKNRNEIFSVLGEIPNDAENVFFFSEFFLGFLKVAFKNKIWSQIEEKVVLFYRVVDFSKVDEDIKVPLIRIKDDYELRQEGFDGSMDMPFDLIDFLNGFCNFPVYENEFNRLGFPSLKIM